MTEHHACEVLRKTDVKITIEKIDSQWLWIYHDHKRGAIAHGIQYCPYCGEELIK